MLLLLLACQPQSSVVHGRMEKAEIGSFDQENEDSAVDSSTESQPVEDSAPVEEPPDSEFPELLPPGSCGFDYWSNFDTQALRREAARGTPTPQKILSPVAYPEPLPKRTWKTAARNQRGEDVSMPDYNDSMPLFERSESWSGTRCYELPEGAVWLSEEQAWALYRDIAEQTTGVPVEIGNDVRTVIGIRGSFPGEFRWNGNLPQSFNDSLVLIWRDSSGGHVREFPVNTDTGAYNFGTDSSSSLKANRRYRHEGGWHRGSYEALTIAEYGYYVTDDTNHNGHWDSDRNGWLPPDSGEDHTREGSGHNIHVASVDGPLEDATIDNWSAGCQTIPGMKNWTSFITEAWPGSGVELNYFLVDARDIAPEAFGKSCSPDGSLDCPYRIESLPYSSRGSTKGRTNRDFASYNCSGANEGGAEEAYLLVVDDYGTLSVTVEDDDQTDIDIHLLEAGDSDACLVRDDTDFTWDLSPGRYWILADSYVSNGQELPGDYLLTVRWD